MVTSTAMSAKEVLISNINKLHANPNSKVRIRRGLQMQVEDPVFLCKQMILMPNTSIWKSKTRVYVLFDNNLIVIDAKSYAVISARKVNSSKGCK